jgi:hypothetical protein
MIVTDQNEAFRHNSCKKLAQLGKVIHQMSSQACGRYNQLFAIHDQAEKAIVALIERHQEKAEAISKALVQFRKKCVDSSCREWGAIYKQIKIDLLSLYSAQSGRISEIVGNRQKLDRAVKSLQAPTLQTASVVLVAADDLFKDMKAKTRPATATRRLIRQHVDRIVDKFEQFQKEREASFRAQRAGHAKDVARSRREITATLKEELDKRRGPFGDMRARFVSLETDVKDLREQQRAAMKLRDEMMAKHKADRNALLADTREQWRSLRSRTGSEKDRQQLEQKSHTHELNDLKRALQLSRTNHETELSGVQRQIDGQIRQRQKYAETHENEMKRRSNR